MNRQCESCGEIREEKWMLSYNSGRRTHWYCWECWKKGQGEVTGFETQCKRRKIREKDK